MKKILLVLLLILLLYGCEQKAIGHGDLVTYCDKEYGVEYVRDNGAYRGGITVRLDENGNVIHCE